MMKCHIGTLLIAAIAITSVSSWVANSRSVAVGINNDYKKPLQIIVARAISDQVVSRLEKHFQNQGPIENRGSTLIPPVDDPAFIEPVCEPIDISLPEGPNPILVIKGSAAITESTTVTGLSQIVDDFTVNLNLLLGTLGLEWDFSVPAIDLTGAYNLLLDLTLGETAISVFGNGKLTASVKDVFLKFNAKGRVLPKVSLVELNVDFGFADFAVDGDQASFDGNKTNVNWEELSSEINGALSQIWNEENKLVINEMVRCSLDYVVGDCTIVELINATGVPECLRSDMDELNELCFPDVGFPTSPTEENTAPTDENTAPTDENTAPTDENTAPTDENTAPSDENTAPTDENTAPTDENTAPTDENTAPTDENTAPTDENTAPTEETTDPSKKPPGSSGAANWPPSVSHLMSLLFASIIFVYRS